MDPAVTCSWLPQPGAESSDVAAFCPPEGPASSCPCELTVQGRGRLTLLSSARTCEVREWAAGSAPAYVTTLRAAATEQTGVFRLEADLQRLCSAQAAGVTLRLLSLHEARAFRLHSLAVDAAEAQPPAAAEPAQAAAPQTAASQMEEIRSLLRRAQAGEGPSDDPRWRLMASIAGAALRKQGPAGGRHASTPPGAAASIPASSSAAPALLSHATAGMPAAPAAEAGQRQPELAREGHAGVGALPAPLQEQLRGFEGAVQAIIDASLQRFELQLERAVSRQLQRLEARLSGQQTAAPD